MKDPFSSDPQQSSINPSPVQMTQVAAGWTAGLTLVVAIGLIIEAVTGLWILLAPFSVVAQLQVIAHTVAGLMLLGPFAVYQWRHWRDWRAQTMSVVMLLGYVGMALTLICMVSGVIVAAQALFGRRLSTTWDDIHLLTGLGLVVLVVIHAALAYVRRRSALKDFKDFKPRFRRRGIVLAMALLGFGVVLGLTTSLLPRLQTDLELPPSYRLPEYSQQFKEYRGSPFAPSYARTSTGKLINPAVLSNSASCGSTGCHEQIVAEWEPSAHRFSAMNPPFQAVQKEFAHERGAAETRYCAGCHDPISLFAGAKDPSNVSLSAPGMQEGSSCAACHSISKVDQRGNADYILTPPQKYLGETTPGLGKLISDFLIRAYPRQHLADYNRSVLHTAEFCGACHKQFVPEALNKFGSVPAQNQYDEWRKSHWNNTEHADKSLGCRDCHMRLVKESTDAGIGGAGDPRHPPGDGAHRHHGFIGTNLFMPAVLKLPHYEEQNKLTEEWIKGQTVLPEIANIWPAGPAATIEVSSLPTVAPGGTLELQTVVRNTKAGHNFITGPLDLIRAWVHLKVVDAGGETVAEWGSIDPATREIFDRPGVLHTAERTSGGGTLVLESVPLDNTGTAILRHELWRKAGGVGQRIIFPGYADKHSYRTTIPSTARTPLTVTAELEFRRYRQEFLNLVLPDMERSSGVYQPTVTMDTATRRIDISTPDDPPSPGAVNK